MKAIAISLLALVLLSGSACTDVSVLVHQRSNRSGLTGTNCKLQRELPNEGQKTDFWCWAASAHTVIEYMKREPVEQCNLVSAVFRSELDGIPLPNPTDLRPDCCMIVGRIPDVNDPDYDYIKAIDNVCGRNGSPEKVFNTEQFRMHFELYEYDLTNPGPQGLTWEEIVAEICADRPMISAILYSLELGGGGHTVVIGGYNELEDGSQWVHVYDPGYNTLEEDYYLWPYEVYLGQPGVFTHVRDYKNIYPL